MGSVGISSLASLQVVSGRSLGNLPLGPNAAKDIPRYAEATRVETSVLLPTMDVAFGRKVCAYRPLWRNDEGRFSGLSWLGAAGITDIVVDGTAFRLCAVIRSDLVAAGFVVRPPDVITSLNPVVVVPCSIAISAEIRDLAES